MALISPTAASGGSSSPTATATSSPRLLPLLDVVTILASSSSTHFDRAPDGASVVRLKGRPLGTIADAITNVPTTWTLVNPTRLASAVASGDSITLTHVGTSSDILYNATATAGHYKRGQGGVPFTPCRHTRIFHLAGTTLTAASSSVAAGIIDSNNRWVVRADLFDSAGTYQFRYIYNDTTSAAIGTRTVGEIATGTWFKLVYDEHTRSIQFYYSHGSYGSGEPSTPSSWTLAISGTAWPNTGTFSDAFCVERQVAAGAAPVGVVSGWRSFREPSLGVLTGVQDNWNALGYAATSDALLLADLDYGSSGGLPDQASIRLALADAINRYPAESASWTFSLTGSDTSAAACTGATTYQTAAALTLKAPGTDTAVTTAKRYWRLRAIATSASSTQAGSIDLARIPGVYAVAS